MKKVFLAVAVMMFFIAGSVFAQETVNPEKVFGSIDIRNDFIFPEKGDDMIGQSVNILFRYKSLGGYLETDYKSKDHSLTLKPAILFCIGQWSLLGGMSTNSKGADFAQTGIWYANSLGKLNFLVDARNYWSITSQSNGYFEIFSRATYPVIEKVSAGVDLDFTHWWGDGHNCYFIGPRISYQLTERISIYARVSREWNVLDAGTETTDRIRLGVAVTF